MGCQYKMLWGYRVFHFVWIILRKKKMIGSWTMGFATVLFGYCGLFGLDYCLQLSIGRLLKKSSLFCHFVWTMVDYF